MIVAVHLKLYNTWNQPNSDTENSDKCLTHRRNLQGGGVCGVRTPTIV